MIATPRLLLRPFTLDDVPKLFAMSQEDGLTRWIPDQVYRDPKHAEEVVRALMACTAQHPEPRVRPYVLGIEHDATLIGHVGLSAARGSVEIGYAVEQALEGKGFATEAVTAMSGWARGELGLAEVLGIVADANARSCRVLEKSGFARIDDGSGVIRIYRR